VTAFFVGIGTFVRGIPAWVWAVIAVPIVMALLVLLIIHWTDARVEQAVQVDRNEAQIEIRGRQLEAERTATYEKEQRDQAAAVATQELRNEVAKGVAEPVGPGVRSVLERMREQQTKGRR